MCITISWKLGSLGLRGKWLYSSRSPTVHQEGRNCLFASSLNTENHEVEVMKMTRLTVVVLSLIAISLMFAG